VEKAQLGRRPVDRAAKAPVNSPRRRGGGDHRGLPPACPAAARRLPLCPPLHYSASARSSLYRCLQRHGIGRLPEADGSKPAKQAFKAYPIGFFHTGITEVHTAEGKLYLFFAIDRARKFAFTELYTKATTRISADFLRALIKAVPYKIHTVLTDNGIHFTDPKGGTWIPPKIRQMIARKEPFRVHAVEYACALPDIDHRLTKPKHPRTNGQVERMNRIIKGATVRRFHYDAYNQLRSHLADFVQAYNVAKRLKTLKGLTPYEFICNA
jgi:transposase InsO family protein